ncbi:MAG: preprotein translocase subunit SecE [Clostridiaceae bacterium]|nr:preprotein translocase subunit SecE [Clostridiaceae bacterium]
MTFRDAMARAGKWFRELKSEFKKVVWPTKKQVLKNTAVVLVVLVIVGVLVGLLDFAFEKLILEQLLKLATGY